jgi:glycolate oxidase iron-sulfur subunit
VDERDNQPGTGANVAVETEPGRVGIFDEHEPPSAERIADCVHCGFCLPTCPTYALWGEEMDSPRGRIYLMKLGRDGTVELDDTFVRHIDQCLGCMACVTACPSGVLYNELIEATRPQIERNYRRPPLDRAFRTMVFALFPYRGRVRAASVLGWAWRRLGVRALAERGGLLRLLPARLRALEALMPDVTLADLAGRPLPALTPAATPVARRRVGLLTGCVQAVYFGGVNQATARVLAADGCDVVAPPGQGCCGALMLHAGQEPGAKARAKALIAEFERAGVDTVVVNAAGCGSSMKEYGRLLAGDPDWAERAAAFSDKVRDVTELLAELEPVAERHPIEARAAYHDACHLAHAQGVRAEPRSVLRAIPGLEVVDLPDAEICCGSAGIYNLVEPAPAEELGRRKVANVRATDPDLVATGNPGCLLQLGRHLRETDGQAGAELPLLHPVELVDASIRGADPLASAAGEPRPVAPLAAAGAGALALAAALAWRRRRRAAALR